MAPAMRIILLALLVLIFASLALSFVQAQDRNAEENTLVYNGYQMLLGKTTGKSANSLNPMLALLVGVALVELVFLLLNKGTASTPVTCSAIILFACLFFLFDAHFTDKKEYDFAKATLTPGLGWWICAVCCFVALVVAIISKSRINAAVRHNQRMAVYENRDLPEGYQDPTVWQIIKKDFKKHWPVYLMVLPLVLQVLLWSYGPMYGIIIAFNEFKPKKGFLGSPWVGLDWYRDFFRGAFAWRTIRNTLFISLLNLCFGFPAPIILALMLNELRSTGFKRIVQTITYIPHFISLVVLSGLMIDFLSSEGVITTAISQVFRIEPRNYLGDYRYFRTVYVASDIWQHLGWDSIIYLSALAGIDMELYEAARIDGAAKLKQTWHITLPGIAPTITILLILRIGSLLSVGYEKIILLYNGTTYETADVISSYVYRVGISDMQFSRSTAINILNSIVNFMLVIVANRISAAVTETSLW